MAPEPSLNRHLKEDAQARARDPGAAPACAVWQERQADLITDFGMEVYNSWFKVCIPESDVEGVLTLAVPTQFMADHIEKNYLEGLQKTLGRKVQFVRRAYASNANWAKEYRARIEKERADGEARRRGHPAT